jgi:hypothetical protein
MTSEPRIVSWFSCGAASAVATKLAIHEHGDRVVPAYCDPGAEDADNDRFLRDCEEWFGVPVQRLKSDKYNDVEEVWQHRRFMAGISGAPCTVEMKVAPRVDFQRVDDVHVFGYTADSNDVARADRMRQTFFELSIWTPLIERGLTKAACRDLLMRAGVQEPRTYALGFPNANCIGCPKATSPAYWALVRKHYPETFERRAKLSRELGARLARVNGERVFIDEIPDDQPTSQAEAPACDFLCAMAAQDLESLE